MAPGDPLEGQVLMIAAAKASVPAQDLPTLVDRVQQELGPQFEEYRRRYEAVEQSPERWMFLVPPDHWDSVAERVGLTTRERQAVQRAHETQLERIGNRTGRSEEFDSALDIRSAVAIAPPES